MIRTDHDCQIEGITDMEELELWDSIAVSGVCLIAEAVGDGWFQASLDGVRRSANRHLVCREKLPTGPSLSGHLALILRQHPPPLECLASAGRVPR